MQPNILLLSAPAQPLFLAAWSVTTPAYVRYSNIGKEKPRSRRESKIIADGRRAIALKAAV